MKRSRLLLVLLLTIAAAFAFTGCTAVITDDDGETYEIPMDEAEEFAREYISEEMEFYIADQINSGYSLADTLGIKEEDIEQIIREEVRNAIQEEIKKGDLVDMVFEEAGVSKEDVQTAVSAVAAFSGKPSASKKEEPKVEEKKAEEKKAEQKKTEEPKSEEKKVEEKKEEKKEEPKAEEKKEEKKEEPKAEEKKEEKKEEPKAEEKKTEEKKTEEKKTEEKKAEEPKAEEKKEEKKEEPKAEEKKEEKKSEDKKALDDGNPWVDHDLRENNDASVKADKTDDFYFAVNKDWLVNTKIKEGREDVGTFSDVQEETMEMAKALFSDRTLKSKDAKLIQNFHDALLDWDARNKEGVKPVEGLVLNLQKAQTVDDINRLYLEDEDGFLIPGLLVFGNDSSFNDSSNYITSIDKMSVFLSDPAEYGKRTEYGDRYYEAEKIEVTGMLERLGYKKDQAEEVYEKAISFEGKLAGSMLTATDYMQTDIYEKINNEMDGQELKKLVKDYPFFDILKKRGYGDAKKFLVFEPEYVKALGDAYTDKNIEEIRAYLIAHLVSNCTGLLDEKAYELRIQASNIIGGTEGKVSDEEYAFDVTRSVLTVPMGKTFIEKYDSSKMKKDITGICKDSIDYYRQMLQEEKWLSEETKKEAIKKLDNITINAVYPDKWEDYSSLSIDGLSLFDSYKEIKEFKQKLDAEKTGKKVDRDIWNFDILAANAYYNPLDNSINIIRGILGGIFYQDGMSKEELLGGIGAVIGHEISHAFDTNGAQFDENGNLKNWWPDEDLKAFYDRADKLVSYYDGITAFNGVKVPGENIKTEAIADMAGTKCMLGIAASEKDFDYAKFFEQYAKIWRRLLTYEGEYYRLTMDTHPVHYLRTNVTLQQFDEFLKEYDIKEGDRMYLDPKDRILVW